MWVGHAGSTVLVVCLRGRATLRGAKANAMPVRTTGGGRCVVDALRVRGGRIRAPAECVGCRLSSFVMARGGCRVLRYLQLGGTTGYIAECRRIGQENLRKAAEKKG